ncbi:hypothetical protein B0T44_14795 [Nocardia donostiensis]|nr:hypothetical protein B0T36_23150 [Nocardia donostiensis]OQS19290.1 hypothetical protein B0T44_14795 [Nocardia donostiensis]
MRGRQPSEKTYRGRIGRHDAAEAVVAARITGYEAATGERHQRRYRFRRRPVAPDARAVGQIPFAYLTDRYRLIE